MTQELEYLRPIMQGSTISLFICCLKIPEKLTMQHILI